MSPPLIKKISIPAPLTVKETSESIKINKQQNKEEEEQKTAANTHELKINKKQQDTRCVCIVSKSPPFNSSSASLSASSSVSSSFISSSSTLDNQNLENHSRNREEHGLNASTTRTSVAQVDSRSQVGESESKLESSTPFIPPTPVLSSSSSFSSSSSSSLSSSFFSSIGSPSFFSSPPLAHIQLSGVQDELVSSSTVRVLTVTPPIPPTKSATTPRTIQSVVVGLPSHITPSSSSSSSSSFSTPENIQGDETLLSISTSSTEDADINDVNTMQIISKMLEMARRARGSRRLCSRMKMALTTISSALQLVDESAP